MYEQIRAVILARDDLGHIVEASLLLAVIAPFLVFAWFRVTRGAFFAFPLIVAAWYHGREKAQLEIHLKEQLGLEVGYSTTVRYLHELGYNLRVPRPWPERQNEEQRNAFLDQLRRWQADAGLELWFADECGVEGDPRPRRRWSVRGGRPKVPYLGDHIRANVIGAVCPASGECCTMIFDGVDSDVFQFYLDFLAEEIPPLASKRRLLIVDNASWHKAQRLNWHHFEVYYLPGYSPDLNPIERLWLRLKVDFFSDFIAKSPEQLTQRLCHALTSLMNDPETVASQCAFRK